MTTHVDVTLRGVTPLLQNQMPREIVLLLRPTANRPKYVAPEDPRDEAATKLYLTEDKGLPMVPARCLFACLVSAGKYIKLDGKRQMSTAKSTMLPGFMSITVDHFLIRQPGTKKAAKWEVDIRQGTNPNGSQAVCIIRPRFDAWELSVPITIDTKQIAANRIRELFDIAGSRVGLQDYRPERRGMNGQFRVDKWSEQG